MLQPLIKKVSTLPGLKLLLYYETGEEKVFDVTPYANGNWYGELKNESYFNKVRILSGGTGIEWPDGQDVSPHELYECSVPYNK